MRILIVEDDLSSRKVMQQFLEPYGRCDIAVDGIEAIDAFLMAWDEEDPYEVIFLDIMMPRLDGNKALKVIRKMEKDKKIPEENKAIIIMTTALNDRKSVNEAFELGCEAYAAKPINREKLTEVMDKLGISKKE
ncbi:response regulator [Tindallia californiensis]|uniref:Stage 0 sporulation protein A homolog n=1 Tax=Tindallia californiensis TaxID=159292 RepID=A0A1H3KEU0_9FIRM|nr:response regulator [Tindallia californiensis]SDY50606.1 two-component system, chemotaxis family, response regulator CheY [Tindallia californiensis]